MSIASRTTSIIGHIEDDYNALERLGADLTNVDKNIENIASVVDDIYDKLPKVTGTGSDLSLTPTLKGGMNILPLGNAEQDGTPTPDNPIDVKVVTGDNQVVVSNKNLIDMVETHKGASSVDGSISTNNNFCGFDDYVKIVPNTTYTVTFEHDVGNLYLTYKDKDNNVLSQINNSTSRTFTTPSNAYYVFCCLYKSGGQTIGGYIQLEYGLTATSYIPHQEQSTTLHLGSLELCKIGDYQDVITGSKDNWKVVRKVGKYIFNKTDIVSFTSRTNTNVVQIRNASVLNNVLHNDNINVFCDIAKGKNVYNVDEVGTFTFYNGNLNFGGIFLSVLKTDFSTQAELNTYIDNNTINYYFPLYTPIEEDITDTTLINDLNNLQNLLSYDGTTNITITSDSNNAQMLVQVSALKGE